jgi:S1-C subfamily serine protease
VFDDPDLELRATSGAPLLDDQGRVVGMNIGGSTLNGKPVSSGIAIGSIREALSKALR